MSSNDENNNFWPIIPGPLPLPSFYFGIELKCRALQAFSQGSNRRSPPISLHMQAYDGGMTFFDTFPLMSHRHSGLEDQVTSLYVKEEEVFTLVTVNCLRIRGDSQVYRSAMTRIRKSNLASGERLVFCFDIERCDIRPSLPYISR